MATATEKTKLSMKRFGTVATLFPFKEWGQTKNTKHQVNKRKCEQETKMKIQKIVNKKETQ